MARPLTPQEATEMILALRRQQGGGSFPSAPGRRGKRAGTDPAKMPRRDAEVPRDTGTEE
jgi:hypothetical protein